uniref:DNA-directed DNA polymerase family B exonuclease domain-containing protein n=1 Tax=Panagrolaimus sp. ES5 TaxID=591445 RepID=A0AC34GNB1_9BILA
MQALAEKDNSGVTVRLFGSTNDGFSSCVHITEYRPYFYSTIPSAFRPELKDSVQHKLNDSFARSTYGLTADVEHVVTGLEVVTGSSLYGYKEGDGTQNFFKIYVVSPRIITGFRQALSRGVLLCGVQPEGLKCHEANIDFEVRFMVDTNLVGCGWVELPPKKYRVYNEKAKTTLCQIEVSINVEDLIVHSPEGEWGKVAPLRTLSFDIECAGRPGIFPEASEDPVIQIANMVKLEGTAEPFIRNCFVVGTCAHVVGSNIIECKDEKELLTVSIF